MRVFITGATGYLGNKLAKELISTGDKVHLLARNPSDLSTLQGPNVRVFKGDLLDYGAALEAMKSCDRVIHVAGLARLWTKDANDFYRINVEGTKVVLKAAMEIKVEKFIHTSTVGVIGPSLNMPNNEESPRWEGFNNDYEISKFLAEEEVIKALQVGLPALIVRPTRIFGPGTNTPSAGINRLISGYLKKRFVFMPFAPEKIANYGFIDDIAAGHIQAMKRGITGEKYTLGGENVTYDRLYSTIKRLSPSRGIMLRAPKPAIQALAFLEYALSKLLGREPSITPNLVERLGQNAEWDCSKAIHDIGYQITPFEDAIRLTIISLQKP